MLFKRHPELKDSHAFLSPSKYSWVNYSDDKLVETFSRHRAAILGTRKHALAHELILLGQKLPDTTQTLNMYVNDCISFRLTPEQIVAYSPNAFGTADAIGFRDEILRIFDYKSGVTPASDHQLEVYAALFCLEYNIKPFEIGYDLRIYQNDDVMESTTNPEDIVYIMDRIIHFDKILKQVKEDASW